MFMLQLFVLLGVVKAQRFEKVDRLLEQVKNGTFGNTSATDNNKITVDSVYYSTDDEEINIEKIIIRDTESKIIYIYLYFFKSKKYFFITDFKNAVNKLINKFEALNLSKANSIKDMKQYADKNRQGI